MIKIQQFFTLIFLAFVIPLIGRPDLLMHWKILVLLAIWAILIALEPPLEKPNAEQWETDQNTKRRIAVAGILSIWIAVVDWAYLPDWSESFGEFWPIGLPVILLGLALRSWAIVLLGIHFDPRARVLPDHQLITKGPFRFIRHPCYLGSILIFTGSALFLNSLLGLLAALLFMAPAYRARIEVEEALLLKRFPDDYEDLVKKSWKLFPFIY